MRHIAMIGCILALTLAGCTQPDTATGALSDQEIKQIQEEKEHVVTYTADGFKPSHITVKKGDTVTWVSDGPAMWVASNSHPTHADYGLDDHADPVFDQGEAAQVFTFRFNRTGEWQYHNHENAYHHGTVTVTDE